MPINFPPSSTAITNQFILESRKLGLEHEIKQLDQQNEGSWDSIKNNIKYAGAFALIVAGKTCNEVAYGAQQHKSYDLNFVSLWANRAVLVGFSYAATGCVTGISRGLYRIYLNHRKIQILESEKVKVLTELQKIS